MRKFRKESPRKTKIPSFQIKFPEFWKLTPEAYSCLSFRQVSSKFPKSPIWKIDKTLKTLATRTSRQVSKFPEISSKKFQVSNGTNLLCDCLHGKFPSFQIFPLHYMEGMRYPPWMEWRLPFLHLTNLYFYQQRNSNEHEQQKNSRP